MNDHITTDTIDPSWTDPAASVRFLQQLREHGPWNLSAIGTDGRIVSATFTDPEAAERWIAARAGEGMNIHYTANPATEPTGKGGRATRADVDRIEYVFADADLDKLADDSFLASLSLEERKERVLPRLKNMRKPGTASFIIDSGGGYQVLYRLDPPLEVTADNVELAERVNAGLAAKVIGGDASVRDIAHLLHLPFTANIPNATKRARGRVPCAASVAAVTDELYEADEFPLGRVRKQQEPVEVEFDAAEEVTDLEALATEFDLDADTVAIIRDGRLKKPKAGDDSNSAWAFDGILRLLRRKVPHALIKGLLLDATYGISKHILSARHTPDDQERYAERQIRNALSAIKAEHDEPAFREPVDLGANVSAAEDDMAAWFSDNFTPIGQVDIAGLPQTPWLIPGLLLYGETSLVGGRGGVGKSLHAWQIGVAVARGIEFAWWPAPERRRKVLVLSGEDDVNEIERRVAAACQAMKIERSDLGDDFMVWKHRNIHLAERDMKSGAIERTKLWSAVRWAVQHLDVGLVIVDPLIKASMGFAESKNEDMEALFTVIRSLTEGYECAVLIDDHFAKGGIGGDQAAIRGASSKVDAARVAITLTQMTEKEWKRFSPPRPVESYVRFYDPKQNYAKKQGGQWLQLVEFPVGNGETRPALRAVNLLNMDEFLDPATWPHREAFLRLVMEGREEGEQHGWPYCSATKGPKDSRLDSAVAERFNLTIGQARDWIRAFDAEGSIMQVDWMSPTRNQSKVWQINPDFEPSTEYE